MTQVHDESACSQTKNSAKISLIKNRETEVKNTLAALGLKEENFGISPYEYLDTPLNTVESIDPATNKVIAKIHLPTWEAIGKSLDLMVERQKKWASLDTVKRIHILREINERFIEKKEAYAKLLAIEVGKTIDEALGEEVEVHHTMDLIVKQAHHINNCTTYPSCEDERQKQGCVRYQKFKPLGNVQKTCAFNFPRAVFLWGAFPALAAGNGVHLKPHPGASLVSLATVKDMNEVLKTYGFEGLVALSVTDNDFGYKLWQDERFQMVEATGSENMGRAVVKAISERAHNPFIRKNLELGGNNASVIREDANLDIAVNLLTFSSVGLQGQRCTTTSRIFVHWSKYDAFLEKFINAYKTRIRIGDPLSQNVNFGPLFHKPAVDLYKKTLERLPENEAEIVYGGRVIQGNFVEPAIVAVKKTVFPYSYEEYFVPIVFVIPFTNDDDVIREVNNPGYGLSGSVFTKDQEMFNHYVDNVQASVFNNNYGTSGAEVVGVFGGVGRTGYGQMLGSIPEGKLFEHYTYPIGGLIAPAGVEAKHAQGVRFA